MSFLDFDDNPKPSSSPFLLSQLSSSSTSSSSSPSLSLNSKNKSSNSTNATNLSNSTTANDARDAAEEEALLELFKKDPKAALSLAESYVSASQAPRQAMTEITPVPGFVVQTHTLNESNKVPLVETNKSVIFPKDTLVYINICSSDQLPKPTAASESEIQKAINAEEGVTYQVPFQLSPPRQYRDSVSKSYLVVDACIHTDALKRAERDFDYKLYIMELAMEWTEEKCRIELSRNLDLPNIKSKDELKKRSVILPKPPAIQEMSDDTVKSKTTLVKSTSKVAEVNKVEEIIHVPSAGNNDLVPTSRSIPCPKGTMGIIIEFNLPNHRTMDGITVDIVSPDKLVLHAKSQDGGNDYHAEIDLLNEPVDLENVKAEFNKSSRTLRVYTIKKRK